MNYGYIRVSSREQNLDRQIEAIDKWKKENNVEINDTYADKESGKNFERENYQAMRRKLQKGDLVIIKSIDRLGRNYDMIIEEWQYVTKTLGADIVVIDMPLLDTRNKQSNLTGKFIADLVLQILSYVAETERRNIKERQKEGIAIAKQKGIKLGAAEKYSEEFRKSVQYDYEHWMKFKDLVVKYGCSRDRIDVWRKKFGWKRKKEDKVRCQMKQK